MVADGMSAGVLSLADNFSRLVRDPDTSTHWLALMRNPATVHGLVETFSLNSMVTDSAAAASAWGSGSRVFNGALNVLPDGAALTPLASLVRDTSRRIGLVTSTTMTHATPAGFAVNQEHRSAYEQIAPQYLGRVDVLLGGGREAFDPASRTDQHNLIGDYLQHGYTHWSRRLQVVSGAAPARVLGLFNTGHLPYVIDQRQSAELRERIPKLAEMTRAALRSLDQGPHGFFLMIEGGRIDHAAHANDAAGVLWEQLAFDDAVGEVLVFMAERDDTLLVITTDHGNSNPGLNSMGGSSGGSDACFARLCDISASSETILARIKQASGETDVDAILQIIEECTALKISPEHADILARTLRKESTGELNGQHANGVGALGQILGNHTGIGWTGITHTADYAILTATGPGSERFSGFTRNTDAFRIITQLLDIDHVNPVAPSNESRLAVYHHQPQYPATLTV
jgi:alkaline phosphatase